jgi:hypothetical protein
MDFGKFREYLKGLLLGSQSLVPLLKFLFGAEKED